MRFQALQCAFHIFMQAAFTLLLQPPFTTIGEGYPLFLGLEEQAYHLVEFR